ncbi:MAG: hypothetical protein ACTSYU_10620, partial [Promethearchaeota archaeon]
MSSEIYNDKRVRQQLSLWGRSLIRYITMQVILLVITTSMLIFEGFNQVEVADILYMAFMVGTIIILVRYIQYLIQLKRTSLITNDSFLLKIYKIELVSLIVGFLFNVLIMFVDAIYYSWLYTFICSLPMLILSLALALYFLKWTENFTPNIIEQSSITEFKKGVNLVILSSVLDFIPDFHDLVIYISIFSAVLYLIGFWKIGKTIIRDFGLGQLGDINAYATPDMYSGLGPSRLSSSSIYNSSKSVDYDLEISSSELNSSEKSSQQSSQQSSLCSYCGAPKLDLDAQFCATCGNKYRDA